MKLYVENVGKIEKADIELKDVTVITGYNGTGKSSICKALYGLMDAYTNINGKISHERRSSMVSAVFMWQNKLHQPDNIEEIDDLTDDIVDTIWSLKEIDQEAFSLERLENLFETRSVNISKEELKGLADSLSEIIERDKGEYILFIVSQRIRSIFENQIGHVNLKQSSSMELVDNGRSIKAIFKNNELMGTSYSNYFSKQPIYIEPQSVLDNLAQGSKRIYRNKKERYIRPFLLANEISGDELTLEEFQKREKNIKLIKEILDDITHGHLVKNKETSLFYDERGLNEAIACGNIASGLKPFLMIQRMVENGTLEEGRMLIIDEPEINLHPAWQLKFAKVLVLLSTELKVQVVISTHSPYFLRAIDFYMEEQKNTENGRYYLTKETSQDLYTLVDVTENKEQIYKTMYEPLEEIN